MSHGTLPYATGRHATGRTTVSSRQSPKSGTTLHVLHSPDSGQGVIARILGELVFCQIKAYYSTGPVNENKVAAELIPIRPATENEIAIWTSLILLHGPQFSPQTRHDGVMVWLLDNSDDFPPKVIDVSTGPEPPADILGIPPSTPSPK